MLLYTRKYLGAQLMSIIFRRFYSLRLTRGWIKWRECLSLKERESSKVMTRQISMFRRKIDRVKKRNATLTLYKFVTASIAHGRLQAFKRWRFHAVLIRKTSAFAAHSMASALRRLKYLILSRAWSKWRNGVERELKRAINIQNTLGSARRIMAVARVWFFRRKRLAINQWVRVTRIHQMSDVRRRDLLRSILSRKYQNALSSGMFSWRLSVSRLNESIRKAAEQSRIESVQAEITKTKVSAGVRRLQHILQRWRVRKLFHAFNVMQGGAANASYAAMIKQHRAPRIFLSVFVRIQRRRSRVLFYRWRRVTQHLKSDAYKRSENRLRVKLGRTEHLLQETNLMAAASTLRTLLLSQCQKLLGRAFRTWCGIVFTSKFEDSSRNSKIMGTVKMIIVKREILKVGISFQKWRSYINSVKYTSAHQKQVEALLEKSGKASKLHILDNLCKIALKLRNTRMASAFFKWRKTSHINVANIRRGLNCMKSLVYRREAVFLVKSFGKWKHCVSQSRLQTVLQNANKRSDGYRLKAGANVLYKAMLRHRVLIPVRNAFVRWRYTHRIIAIKLHARRKALLRFNKVIYEFQVGSAFAKWRNDVVHLKTIEKNEKDKHISIKAKEEQAKLVRSMALTKISSAVTSFRLRLVSQAFHDWNLNIDKKREAAQRIYFLNVAVKKLRSLSKAWKQWASFLSQKRISVLEEEQRASRNLVKMENTKRLRLEGAHRMLSHLRKTLSQILHLHFTQWKIFSADVSAQTHRAREKKSIATFRLTKIITSMVKKTIVKRWRKWKTFVAKSTNAMTGKLLKNKFKKMKRDLRRQKRTQCVVMITSLFRRYSTTVLSRSIGQWKTFAAQKAIEDDGRRKTLMRRLFEILDKCAAIAIKHRFQQWNTLVAKTAKNEREGMHRQKTEQLLRQSKHTKLRLGTLLLERTFKKMQKMAHYSAFSRWKHFHVTALQNEINEARADTQAQASQNSKLLRAMQELQKRLEEAERQITQERLDAKIKIATLQHNHVMAFENRQREVESILSAALSQIQTLPPPPTVSTVKITAPDSEISGPPSPTVSKSVT